MHDLQRKIDLQSPGDLIYLADNINQAAQQKLDLHLPPSAAQGKDDAFRLKVEELVRQYVHQTLTLALPSLSVNGLDASPSILSPDAPATETDPSIIDPNDPSYEPYDTRLAQKLRDLYGTLEEETTRVAELRREAPSKAAESYVQKLKQEMEQSDAALEARKLVLNKNVSSGLDDIAFDGGKIHDSWIKGKEGLEALRNITKVKADLERALKAVAEVEMG